MKKALILICSLAFLASCDRQIEIRPQIPPERADLVYPIDNFASGITLKPFGEYITPEDSPVQPEKFQGYHNAVDIEIPESRLEDETYVFAISDCEVLLAKTVSGYGGVIVLGCTIKNEDYTVLYGHLDINSITRELGESVLAGEKLAILGEGYSAETDGERKHLHFAIRKGSEIDLRGYVQNQSELADWVDPIELLGDL